MWILLIIVVLAILVRVVEWINKKLKEMYRSEDDHSHWFGDSQDNTNEPTSRDWWNLGMLIDLSNKYADSVKKDKKK